MPSTGKTPRHRWPSDEYSTPRIGEWSSFTSNVITVRPETTRTLVTAIEGGVLSTSNAALSSSPASAVASGLDGASEATIFTKYVPFGIVVVSQTRIDSLTFLRSVFHAVSPSRRY